MDDYKELRKAAYPPLEDFADAFVHSRNGEGANMEEYITKCLAVKALYPKPEDQPEESQEDDGQEEPHVDGEENPE